MEHLASWNDTPTREAIVRAVESAPDEDRIAVFDNDGTLWCETPMPIQLGFMLERFVAMAEADPALRERQPWKSACEREGGILKAFAGMSDDAFIAQAAAFVNGAPHPTLGRPDGWTVVSVKDDWATVFE